MGVCGSIDRDGWMGRGDMGRGLEMDEVHLGDEQEGGNGLLAEL